MRFLVVAIFAVIASGCRDEAGSVDLMKYPGAGAQSVSAVAFADEAPVDERPAEDRPNRTAKQAFLKASAGRTPIELESLLVPVKAVKKGSTIKSEPPLLPLRHTRTKLVEFESAPFPYHGVNPNTGRPFLDVSEGGRRGHRASSGEVYWEDRTYSDSRVLLHIPRGFDVKRPSLMVIFLHGHGALLQRDVIDRQRVPEQVSEAGVNAVLVAPQLASSAADLSAGKLWQPGGFQRFLDEASVELANAHGDPRSRAYFDKMPIVIVAYSGGYMTAASCIRHGGAGVESSRHRSPRCALWRHGYFRGLDLVAGKSLLPQRLRKLDEGEK